MKILVTGGAGYVGSHTAKALQGQGSDVVVYDNLSTGHDWAVTDCELVIGDIHDKEKLRKVFNAHAIDAVIHFAASSLVGESCIDPAKYYENNVAGSKCLLDVMIETGIKKLVFSSSCAVYGVPDSVKISEGDRQWPINPYGWTKFIIERMLQDYSRAYGLCSIALRYFNAAGAAYDKGIGEMHTPETHVIPLLLESGMGKRDKFCLYGKDYDTRDGSCIRDYIHVNDLAAAHIKAAEKLLNGHSGFDVFNLGTGEGISVLELIAAVEKITGQKVPVEICERRAGDPPVLVADNRKAVKQLEWEPDCSNLGNIIRTAHKWELIKGWAAGDNGNYGKGMQLL